MSARFQTINFITAVPAGASESGTIKMPAGWYLLAVVGSHTNAGIDDQLAMELYCDADQTITTPLHGGLSDDSDLAAAVTLDAAKTGIACTYQFPVGPEYVFVPYGLKYTYTKNGATAVDLTLTASHHRRS